MLKRIERICASARRNAQSMHASCVSKCVCKSRLFLMVRQAAPALLHNTAAGLALCAEQHRVQRRAAGHVCAAARGNTPLHTCMPRRAHARTQAHHTSADQHACTRAPAGCCWRCCPACRLWRSVGLVASLSVWTGCVPACEAMGRRGFHKARMQKARGLRWIQGRLITHKCGCSSTKDEQPTCPKATHQDSQRVFAYMNVL